jgi:UDP-glucose 4-epimerase
VKERNKKIFITGICGFIGKNLAKRAFQLGYEVFGADIKNSSVPNATVFRADIRDKEKMMRLTKHMDYIVHLAAVTSNLEFEKRMEYSYEVNVNGFNSVIEAAHKNGCSKFLYASSASLYANNFSEDAKLNSEKQKNHYAKTKIINELTAASFSDAGLLDTIGLRYFNVYGSGENEKGNYASIISQFIKDTKKGKPLIIYGDGEQSRDFIFIEDAVEITLLLLNKGVHKIYNVGTGKSSKYNDIAAKINKNQNTKHIKNPLSAYQFFTKSDNKRLFSSAGNYRFKTLDEGLASML